MHKVFSLQLNQESSQLSKIGVITLLPKNTKDRLFLKNCRPISLLNTDYKIIAKLLANRTKSVLPLIIDEDQSGYLKGRYIGQNIRLLQDITFFTELNHISGLLLAIDFEKAFDSLNWNFSLKTLSHVTFSSVFINILKLMYNNIESTVLNNGNTGNYFKQEGGVRQRCPFLLTCSF